jgi:hypothetical protein
MQTNNKNEALAGSKAAEQRPIVAHSASYGKMGRNFQEPREGRPENLICGARWTLSPQVDDSFAFLSPTFTAK